MKIQLIGKDSRPEYFSGIVLSTINSPKSLDEFDINVIDLTSKELWRNSRNDATHIDSQNDFKSIQTMVDRKSKAKIIYIMPSNITFYYDSYRDSGRTKYWHYFSLKDQIGSVYRNIISDAFPSCSNVAKLIYENTRTTINSQTYEADFYFETSSTVLTKSDYSEKITTIELSDNEVYATTLKITDSKEELLQFLSYLFENKKQLDAPEWVSKIVFGSDNNQHEIIKSSLEEIERAKQRIDAANAQLAVNLRYKSILYSNGNELAEVVFEILEKLFDYDLSAFKDIKKEDFLIKKDFHTFIGEIKGVTSNIRSEHISQTDVHYQSYMDRLQENHEKEEVHQLLIMAPFRNKEPSQREPVHEQQIALAKRNGCLIIETTTLLRIFEKFLQGMISSEKCVEICSSHTGLLKESDFLAEQSFDPESYRV